MRAVSFFLQTPSMLCTVVCGEVKTQLSDGCNRSVHALRETENGGFLGEKMLFIFSQRVRG